MRRQVARLAGVFLSVCWVVVSSAPGAHARYPPEPAGDGRTSRPATPVPDLTVLEALTWMLVGAAATIIVLDLAARHATLLLRIGRHVGYDAAPALRGAFHVDEIREATGEVVGEITDEEVRAIVEGPSPDDERGRRQAIVRALSEQNADREELLPR